MRLDMAVITLGDIMQMGVMLIGVFIAYSKLKEQLAAIETKLAPLWQDYTDRDRRQGPRRLADRDA
jgi:hypothetical protein